MFANDIFDIVDWHYHLYYVGNSYLWFYLIEITFITTSANNIIDNFCPIILSLLLWLLISSSTLRELTCSILFATYYLHYCFGKWNLISCFLILSLLLISESVWWKIDCWYCRHYYFDNHNTFIFHCPLYLQYTSILHIDSVLYYVHQILETQLNMFSYCNFEEMLLITRVIMHSNG